MEINNTILVVLLILMIIIIIIVFINYKLILANYNHQLHKEKKINVEAPKYYSFSCKGF